MQLIKQTLKTKLSQSAQLYGYLPDNSEEIESNRIRPTVLICPGGGYVMTSDREAEPVALNFIARGYNAFVIRYSVAPVHYPVALLEVATAMQLIRQNAEEWHVDPDKLIVAGFSAGGHLAADFAVNWNQILVTRFGFNAESIKPNGLLLGYSVISSGAKAHLDSFKNLLGEQYGNPELMDEVSVEKHVTPTTPPTFLWHTVTDDTVPVENSMLFASALKENGVSFEMHLFPQGGHGLSLATKQTAIASNGYGDEPVISVWADLFETWVTNNI